ncbi:MAG: alpha/beta fold hydrolase [Clostridiales bacterium]|nr:alpha/beta fold hydrolase [Clostridiales bacterium]
MKKILILALCICLGLTFGACGKEDPAPAPAPEPVTFDEAALTENAKAMADAMLQGDFDTPAKNFDEAVAKQLTPEALKEAFEGTVKDLGAHVDRVSAEGTILDDHYVVAVVEQYEKTGLLIQLTYNTEGKIAGLWLNYAEIDQLVPETGEGYVSEEITIAGDPELPLPGTLTLPEAGEKFPVVILVHGSGSSDRNENINGNKPFADIAIGLAKEGIATIRYDKRYYVYPENGIDLGTDLTLREEVLDDVNAAIALAKSDDRLDSSRIYVLGHSLGGMLTPAIASENPDLAGIISMAGSLRPLWEISYDQNQELIASINTDVLPAEDLELLEEQIAQIEDEIQILRSDAFQSKTDDTMIMGIPVSYWKSLSEYQGMNFIHEISLPILVLQGDADFQVYPDKDYALWQETIGDRDNTVLRLYEGLNHLMMPTQGKRDTSEYAIPGNVAPEVIADIADFIN